MHLSECVLFIYPYHLNNVDSYKTWLYVNSLDSYSSVLLTCSLIVTPSPSLVFDTIQVSFIKHTYKIIIYILFKDTVF